MNESWHIIIAIILILICKTTRAEEADQKSEMIISVKNETVSMSAKDADLKTVIEEIIKQSNYPMSLEIQEKRKITYQFENLLLSEAIERILNNNYALLKDNDKIIAIIVPKINDIVQPNNRFCVTWNRLSG